MDFLKKKKIVDSLQFNAVEGCFMFCTLLKIQLIGLYNKMKRGNQELI